MRSKRCAVQAEKLDLKVSNEADDKMASEALQSAIVLGKYENAKKSSCA